MPTTVQTLKEICSRLNAANVQYIVIGGFAIIFHGLERLTQDIDLLVDPSKENIRKIREALRDLLPEACAEIREEDVENYIVVRMGGDDFVLDLLGKAGGFEFSQVKADIENFEGVEIPVADLESMLKMKKTLRAKDNQDYIFLLGKKDYLENQKRQPPRKIKDK